MIAPGLLDEAASLIEACRKHGVRLVTAESCTGGLIAATLTAIAGSSDVVDRGFVTYSNEAKTELVGVPAVTIAAMGGGPLTAAAHEAGVTVLAGTDSSPHGRVRDEIRLLAAAGLPADVALGAGAWTARRFLGLPGIEEGAPADLVVYDEDPRKDLAVLDAPSRIILRGQIVR